MEGSNNIIYCVIINDRHTDVDIEPYINLDDAVKYARNTAKELCRNQEFYKEIEIDGWCFCAQFSSDGDSVWVVKKCLR